MSTMTFEERTISELDHIRINRIARNLAHTRPARAQDVQVGVLLEALDAAEVLAPRDIPPDVVTMNSRIRVEDLESGALREMTLCYPEDADPARSLISVLSPIGAALLGRRVSERVTIAAPGQGGVTWRIVELVFQPEANGEFTR